QTEKAPVSVNHRQAAQPPLFEQMNGIVKSRFGRNANHVALHHIADPIREIADEYWRLDAEFVEDEIYPFVRIPGPGGDYIGRPCRALEVSVSQRCTDRIHIRILVADDDGLHE